MSPFLLWLFSLELTSEFLLEIVNSSTLILVLLFSNISMFSLEYGFITNGVLH